MRYLKTRDVKSPERGTSLSAGIDMFVPKFNESFIEELVKNNEIERLYEHEEGVFMYMGDNYDSIEEIDLPDETTCLLVEVVKTGEMYIVLKPNGDVRIPSGIHSLFDKHNQALTAKNKSGVATRDKLIVGAELIDADYQGEINIHLFNVGNQLAIIKEGKKIVQFILIDVHLDIPKEIDSETFYDLHNKQSDERGAGGFGSTGG